MIFLNCIYHFWICSIESVSVYHKFDTTIKLRILGMGRVKDVKPMSEEAAIELSSDMLGELIIFSVGAGCIYLEYRRQMKRDQNKENYQNSRIQELESTVGDLGLELEMQKAQIAELRRALTSQPVPQIIRDPQSGRVLQVEKR